jgi:NAD(P)-dependent dehydrogenase (short-subunit alcohol dehydrogenase family)
MSNMNALSDSRDVLGILLLLRPGFFASEMTDQYAEGYIASQQHRMLIPRLGHAVELAATMVWLVSPAAGYVTGQTIVVDGGVSIT